jgi:hypothetical protein
MGTSRGQSFSIASHNCPRHRQQRRGLTGACLLLRAVRLRSLLLLLLLRDALLARLECPFCGARALVLVRAAHRVLGNMEVLAILPKAAAPVAVEQHTAGHHARMFALVLTAAFTTAILAWIPPVLATALVLTTAVFALALILAAFTTTALAWSPPVLATSLVLTIALAATAPATLAEGVLTSAPVVAGVVRPNAQAHGGAKRTAGAGLLELLLAHVLLAVPRSTRIWTPCLVVAG